MIRSLSHLLVVVMLLPLIGCEKEQERMPNYWVDFATVITIQDQLWFQIDNSHNPVLPDQPIDEKLESGERVILNYTPVGDDLIHINHLRKVTSGDIGSITPSIEIGTDPVTVQSIWLTEAYINLILEIEYHHTQHTFGLYRDLTDPNYVDLILSHAKNGDSPGYAVKVYLSVSLRNLSSEEMKMPFRVVIPTVDGSRVLYLDPPVSEENQLS